MSRYVLAVVATLAIEIPLYLCLLDRVHRGTSPWRRPLLANALSHPPAYAAALALPGGVMGLAGFVLIEVAVIGLEATVLAWRGRHAAVVALGASCVANGVSCGLGLALLAR